MKTTFQVFEDNLSTIKLNEILSEYDFDERLHEIECEVDSYREPSYKTRISKILFYDNIKHLLQEAQNNSIKLIFGDTESIISEISKIIESIIISNLNCFGVECIDSSGIENAFKELNHIMEPKVFLSGKKYFVDSIKRVQEIFLYRGNEFNKINRDDIIDFGFLCDKLGHKTIPSSKLLIFNEVIEFVSWRRRQVFDEPDKKKYSGEHILSKTDLYKIIYRLINLIGFDESVEEFKLSSLVSSYPLYDSVYSHHLIYKMLILDAINEDGLDVYLAGTDKGDFKNFSNLIATIDLAFRYSVNAQDENGNEYECDLKTMMEKLNFTSGYDYDNEQWSRSSILVSNHFRQTLLKILSPEIRKITTLSDESKEMSIENCIKNTSNHQEDLSDFLEFWDFLVQLTYDISNYLTREMIEELLKIESDDTLEIEENIVYKRKLKIVELLKRV